MQSFGITDYSIVKKIKGCQLDGGEKLSKLSFSKKDGSELKKVELKSDGKPYGQDSVLNDDEEIIGMFGTKDCNNILHQVGFIVWKPPKF
jgi:hypothetical protein